MLPPFPIRRAPRDSCPPLAEWARQAQLAPVDPALLPSRQVQIDQEFRARLRSQDNAELAALHTGLLGDLFELYDELVFARALSNALRSAGIDFGFRISSRMTKAAAKTTLWRKRRPQRIELAVSSQLLLENFQNPGQVVSVAGVPCATRLQAMQRLFEHELIHVVEFLVFGKSSCRRRPFQTIAANAFGHRSSYHQLAGTNEFDAVVPRIQPGNRVRFDHRRRELAGFVQRITKRATVLVPHRFGRRYSDGRCYQKYLVPLMRLRLDETPVTPAREGQVGIDAASS